MEIFPSEQMIEEFFSIIATLGINLNLYKVLMDENTIDNLGWTPLHFSAQSGSYKLITYFAHEGIDIHLKANDGTNCLHIAAVEGYLNLCRLLIDKHKFDVNVPNKHGLTALHASAKSGNYELFTYIADMATDIYLRTNYGTNCLHIAALEGHLDLCKMLTDKHKFDFNMTDNNGWTALHFSAKSDNYELIAHFADTGSDIHLKTNDGTNCLHIAAVEGHLNLCKVLINKHNFDPNIPNKHGMTALHGSAQSGKHELFTYFADMGINIHLKANDGSNCLHIAAQKGHLNLCKVMIDKHKFDTNVPNKLGLRALHCSALSGNYELVTYFADMGTDINIKTNDGYNCLHIAALEGHLNLCKVLIAKRKFDVNVVCKNGWTALHCSVKSGNYELVTYCANMGTDIYSKTNYGTNCLHIAALKGHLNLCKLLIHKHKFDLHMTDNNGWAALHFSAQSGTYELIAYLTDMGTDIYRKTNDGANCLHIAALEGHLNLCKVLIDKHKFDVNVNNRHGLTALHCSAYFGNYELLTYFSNMGTDIHCKTNDGWNCLHIAAVKGHLNLCKLLIDKHKLDLHMTDKNGWTALHCSAKSGNCKLIAYFTDIGTDIYLKTKDGTNCLNIAALEGHFKLCKVLIDKHKFDVNVANKDGWTALHCSAYIGNYDLLTYFANMGTDIHLETNDGRNCLHIAILKGHLNLCKVLIDKHNFDTNVPSKAGWIALHYSALIGNYDLVSYFADMGTDIYLKTNHGWNCLHIAAFEGNLNLCKVLILKHKFDINLPDKGGWAALHCSAKSGNYKLTSYFADMGTDIHLKTYSGSNCLHIAALAGHFNLCKVLIDKHKFDLHMTNIDGWAALHFSAQSSNYELVTYFADMGTDIHLKTNDGRNCLHIAACKGNLNLCKLLIDKHKFDLHMTDNDGWAALHFSAKSGNYELVSYFEELGADIHIKTSDGGNCLHIAALEGHLKICKYFLETHDFDVNMKDNAGRTSLHNSAKNGSIDLFLYILGRGSEIYCKTNNMENALHFSAQNGHVDICEFILEHFTKDYEENSIRNEYTLISQSYMSQVFYKYNTIFLHAMDNEGNTYLHLAAVGNQVKVCELLLKYDTDVITLLNKKDETARNIAQKRSHKDVLRVLKAEYDRTGMFLGFLSLAKFCYLVLSLLYIARTF